jgi:regulator of protease activity HflC (stomatin/prohibitin superfamily)
LATITLSIHKVDEGHVGLYWLGGALMSADTITTPGYHVKFPFSTFTQVQITIHTDLVQNIPCGTSGGTMLYFDKIEVVNRLRQEHVHQTVKNYTLNYDQTWIFDKIHHSINEFCSVHTLQEVYIDKFDKLDESLVHSLQKQCDEWAPGIQIIAVRVTKPRIPPSVFELYQDLESIKTKYLIAKERQVVRLKEAQTEYQRKIAESERITAVAKVDFEMLLSEKSSELQMAKIRDDVYIEKSKSVADAEFYSAKAEADANTELLSPEFLKLKKMEALTNNLQIYFGDKIPNIIPQFSQITQPFTPAQEL